MIIDEHARKHKEDIEHIRKALGKPGSGFLKSRCLLFLESGSQSHFRYFFVLSSDLPGLV